MTRWSMKCIQCGADLGGLENKVASISLSFRGDEMERVYFLCTTCDVYTAWVCIEDFFTDKDTMFAEGPVPREKGDLIVDKIRKCPAPNIKSCRCLIHEELSD